MNDVDRLIGALWDLYAPEIVSGQPVYFGFCQESVKGALEKAGIAIDSPLEAISDAARQCFDISAGKAILREDALVKGSNGRSMAIVLVCQQVLAVEAMIDDGQVSRNAYFPRLRELMSGELALHRQCPLSAAQFIEIWRAFRRELEDQDGFTDETVTFHFERYTGANKARGFPFSQALLSHADLLELQRHGRRDRLLSRRGDEAWREVKRAARHLGRRAQKLISAGSLHEEILDQVRQYLEQAPVAAPLSAKRAETKRLELGISIDSDDIFAEEFFAFVRQKGTSAPIQDDIAIQAKLTELLPEDGYVFCPPSETDDYWLFQDRDVTVTAGRTLLIMARRYGMQRARAILDGLNPSLDVPENRWHTLAQSAHIHVCRVELPEGSRLDLTLRAGRISQSRSSVSIAPLVEWLGGVCVDLRGRRYLREALPDTVRFGPAKFAISDVIGVSGQRTSWSELKERLDARETDVTLDLSYPNGKVARLSVAVMPRSMPMRVGFPIEVDGTIGPRLQPIDDCAYALTGYSEPIARVQPVDIAEVADLVREIRSGKKSRYSEDECRVLCERVNASSVPSILKSLIIQHLKSSA